MTPDSVANSLSFGLFLSSRCSLFLEFRHPYLAVGLEIEADAHVTVVRVDVAASFLAAFAPVVLADLAAGVITAAAAHVLAATTTPQGGGTDEAEGVEDSIVGDGYHGLLWSSSAFHGGMAFGVADFAVLPAFGGVALAFLGLEVSPLLAFVERHMTGKESARLGVGGGLWPWGRRYVQLGTHLHSIIWS